MKRKLYLILIFVFSVVFVGSTIGLGVVLYRYRQADELYDDLQDRYVTYAPSASQAEQSAADVSGDSPSEEPPVDLPDDVPAEPIEPEYAPISVDFGALLAENSEVVGWLYCEGTPINYPVMCSGDNEKYLHRDLHGEYLSSGTPFVDERCSAVGADRNHIIYGHNMKNGTMFGTLGNYKEQSYYDQHPVLYYLTPERDYKIELFSGLVTKSDSEVYGLFPDAGAFDSFLRELQENSTFRSDVAVTGADHIVTLSTCSYEFNNARYVVFGKLTALT